MPDGTYRWKDEDELEQAAALGIVDAAAVRAEVSASSRSGRSRPAGRSGDPTPTWPIPQLPEGWDRV